VQLDGWKPACNAGMSPSVLLPYIGTDVWVVSGVVAACTRPLWVEALASSR